MTIRIRNNRTNRSNRLLAMQVAALQESVRTQLAEVDENLGETASLARAAMEEAEGSFKEVDDVTDTWEFSQAVESQVQSELEGLDVSDDVDECIRNHDFSDVIESALDGHDFSEVTEAVINDSALTQAVEDAVEREVTNHVDALVNENKELRQALIDCMTRIEALESGKSSPVVEKAKQASKRLQDAWKALTK